MAKRRRSSKKKTSTNSYSPEFVGLILILIGILGLGFGAVGIFIKKLAMYAVGELWLLILMVFIFIGIYLLFKRQLPTLFTSKLVGFYLLLIVVIVLAHFSFIRDIAPKQIMDVTMHRLRERTGTIVAGASLLSSGQTSYGVGGGMIGAFFAFILASLFDKIGTLIVLVILSIISIVLMFDFSLSDALNKTKDSLFTKDEGGEDGEDEDEDEEEEEEEKPKKSLLSLFGKKKKEEVKATPVTIAKEIKEETEVPPVETEAVVNKGYVLPRLSLLDPPETTNEVTGSKALIARGNELVKVLADFQIPGARVVATHVGPAVTQYELDLPAGTKVSRILNINKEIALGLAAKDVRIQAPIPGKSTVGIEIPNGEISAVKIRGILQNITNNKGIQAALGKDLMGTPRYFDITKMPHLLIAGSTGSGKSVCTNSIIISILMRYKPDEVKLVLVDPKQVELSNYNGIPHLLLPVVTDPKKAAATLQRIVVEMDNRYRAFAENSVKKIDDYNDLMSRKGHKDARMPYIVVIIDEMADLMVVARKEVEDSIMRITQLARAAGIHLITATQRPSTDVITGIIKANIPSRIAFAVASQVDSRTILDGVGAEKLLGKGDMLFLPMGQNTADRIQGCYVSDDEIERVINACKEQQTAVYDETFQNMPSEGEGSNGIGSGPGGTDDDPLYNEIVEFAMETGKVSASLLQRRFRLGYNRAARIVDQLEERGIIGPANGSKPREVLIGKEE